MLRRLSSGFLCEHRKTLDDQVRFQVTNPGLGRLHRKTVLRPRFTVSSHPLQEV